MWKPSFLEFNGTNICKMQTSLINTHTIDKVNKFVHKFNFGKL